MTSSPLATFAASCSLPSIQPKISDREACPRVDIMPVAFYFNYITDINKLLPAIPVADVWQGVAWLNEHVVFPSMAINIKFLSSLIV